MSLIQEALKRKSEETAAVQPPVKETVEPPPDGKSPRAPLIVLIILLLAGLLAVLTGFSLRLIKPKPADVPSAVQEPAATPPEPVMVSAAPVQAVETAVIEPVAEPVVKEKSAPEIKPVWPELKLTGIARRDSQHIAILNDRMLSAGRKLGEVTIVEVQDRHIVVEYCGERRILYIDE